MRMTLTTGDLTAIKEIVVDSVEDSKRQTVAAFVEVHKKMDDRFDDLSAATRELSDKVDAKDGKLENAVVRVDRLEKHIGMA